MGIFETEIFYQKLLKTIKSPSISQLKLKVLANFFSLLIKEENQIKYHSYYSDLAPEFLNIINKNEIEYCPPDEIEKLILITEYFRKVPYLEQCNQEIIKAEEILRVYGKKTENILNGEERNGKRNLLNADSIAVVLIEKSNNSENEGDIETGLIIDLNLSSSIRSKNEKVDKIEFKNLIDLNEREIIKHLNSVVLTAKRGCESKNIKTHSYNYIYFFNNQEYIYSGSSLGIGAICLAYNSILINEIHKNYFKFRGDCVFSGEVDENGNLQKLDDKSLKIKLKTVFFSSYQKFILPEGNITLAKKELIRLQLKYPKRELDLIPISNFESVFKNLDIVERYELKLHQKIKANYKKYQVAVNWVISVTAILIIGFFVINYLVPHLDRNPVMTAYESDCYTLYNKHNIKVWESEKMEKANAINSKEFLDKKIILADVNGDSKNEFIYITRSDSNNINNRKIYCFNPNNSQNWIYIIPEKKIFFDNKVFPDFYRTLNLFNYNSQKENFLIVSGILCDEYPFSLIKLDLSGKFISEYWNSGFLTELYSYDIDGNGEKEIIAGGCNNLYRKAALAIFIPGLIEGSSPETNPLGNGIKGTEKYYILFPRSIVNFNSGKDINIVISMNQYRGKGIEIAVNESGNEAIILYHFDENMNIENMTLSSSWNSQYDELVSNNKIKPITNFKEYENSLKDSVLYWNGEKFVNYPVMNKYYIQARDSLKAKK